MNPWDAELVPTADALAEMSAFGDAARLAGSVRWCRAASAAGEVLVGVAFTLEGRRVGAAVLAAGTADWRSGSPGQRCLRWPAAAFGYGFAPVWDRGYLASTPSVRTWFAALRAAAHDCRIELRRCAPAGEAPPAHRTLAVTPGPATWEAGVEGREAWLAGLLGRHRRDLAYYRRRLLRAGAEFRDGGTDLERCFALHRARVAAKGQRSAYLIDPGPRFLCTLAREAGNALRVTELWLDGAPIAAALSFVDRGHYQCFMPGWDPRHGKLDLGRQVIYHQVLAEFDRGLGRIDLLGGDLDYKRELGLQPCPTLDVVARPTGMAVLREDLVRGAARLCRGVLRS